MLLKVAIISIISSINIIWYPTFQFLSENRLGSNNGETYKKNTKEIVVIHPKNDNWNTLFSLVSKWRLKGSKYIKNRAIKSPDNTAIIKFFKKKYPNQILSVKLEELTFNKEEIAKNIYEFCGLEWDKKALEFYKRKDLFTSTASNLQIRNGLHNYDKNKYKPYYYLLKNFQDKYEWLNQ